MKNGRIQIYTILFTMECSICMEAIEGETNLSKTECGHAFHFQCLLRWTRRHTSCPMCRRDFVQRQEGEENLPQPISYIDNSHGLVGIPAQVEDVDRFIEIQCEDYEIPERTSVEPCRKLAKEFIRLHRMGNLKPRRKKTQIMRDVLGISCSPEEEGYRSA